MRVPPTYCDFPWDVPSNIIKTSLKPAMETPMTMDILETLETLETPDDFHHSSKLRSSPLLLWPRFRLRLCGDEDLRKRDAMGGMMTWKGTSIYLWSFKHLYIYINDIKKMSVSWKNDILTKIYILKHLYFWVYNLIVIYLYKWPQIDKCLWTLLIWNKILHK